MVTIPDTFETAFRALWNGICSVYAYQKTTDAVTGRTTETPVLTLSDIPCRLVFSVGQPAAEADGALRTAGSATLLVGKDVSVPPGVRVDVTQDGTTAVYEQSGVPAVFSHHQEIQLKRREEWT